MLPYAGYVDPESTLAIGVHHDGHLEDTERTFCSAHCISCSQSTLSRAYSTAWECFRESGVIRLVKFPGMSWTARIAKLRGSTRRVPPG